MTITPDTPARTWRDLADQLTPAQVDGLARHDSPRAAEALLAFARDYAARNLVDAAYAEVPVPAGATDTTGWEKMTAGGYSRGLVWREFDGPGDTSAEISGRQGTGGSFTRCITLWTNDGSAELTGGQARELAAMLTEAAEELDRLDHEVTDTMDVTSDDAADGVWADPAWQVDSTTRPCCGSIGRHAHDCGEADR